MPTTSLTSWRLFHGEAQGPVLDERDGHTGDIDLTPQPEDRKETEIDGDREEAVPVNQSVQDAESMIVNAMMEVEKGRKFPSVVFVYGNDKVIIKAMPEPKKN